MAQAQAAAAEQKRAEAEKSAAEAGAKVAALAQPAAVQPNLASLSTGAPQADVAKSVQTELRRVGCLSGDADGNWNTASQRSLSQFNRYAKTRFDTKLASTDALDSIKTKTARVCPLVCDRGYKADGDSCVKIVCAEGSFLNDDNECEKRREKKPVATREKPEPRQAPAASRAPAIGQAPSAFQAPQAKQATIGRYQGKDPSIGANGRPLTGQERQQGCSSFGAVMSGVCP